MKEVDQNPLLCGICIDRKVSAKTDCCTHTFCNTCIKGWVKKNNDCPICRRGIANIISIKTNKLLYKVRIEKKIPAPHQQSQALIEELQPDQQLIIPDSPPRFSVNFRPQAQRSERIQQQPVIEMFSSQRQRQRRAFLYRPLRQNIHTRPIRRPQQAGIIQRPANFNVNFPQVVKILLVLLAVYILIVR